ncbi:MAG: cytochrome-c oxidase, cbb3-type subunit III [Gammaproteobacteria bacterium]|nr:MAG: cytochrome-c oxidase, cbb3-type subunit III [Gammaproteobacteria bacterium]
MSSFWSIWITVLTLGTLIGCYFLLRWCLTNFAGVEEGESMGHSFDGIEELNNPMPKWWSTFFLITIIWGFGYLLMYPGLGNWKGLFGWQSSNQGILTLAESKERTLSNLKKDSGVLNQYDREVAAANAKYGPIFKAYAARTIEDLASDKKALKVGQRLFIQNCAQCHGSDARGSTGFPNLADNAWLYGGSPATIEETILKGRKSHGMMAWSTALGGEQGVKEVAAYVLSLSGRKLKPEQVALVEVGKPRFAMCMGCHGVDGKGSAAMGIKLGAPNLTDNTWLYGGSVRRVEESIRNGRAGIMPAWENILGKEKVHVISAYVYSLSHAK